MKKLVVLFLVMSAFTFVSCGNDDDNFGGLVGKWYLYSTERDGEIKVHKYGECGKDYTEFESNGNFKIVEFDYYNDCKGDIHYGTYSVSGNKITVKHSNGKTGTVTFNIKGNEMFMSDRGRNQVYKRL